MPPLLPAEVVFAIIGKLSASPPEYRDLKSVALSGSALHAEVERLLYKSVRLAKVENVDKLLDALASETRGRARASHVQTFRLSVKADATIHPKILVIRAILALLLNLIELDIVIPATNVLTEGGACHPALRTLTLSRLTLDPARYFAGKAKIRRLSLGHFSRPPSLPQWSRGVLLNLEDVAGPLWLLKELIPGRPITRVSTWISPSPERMQALCNALTESTGVLLFFSVHLLSATSAETFQAMARGLRHVRHMQVTVRHMASRPVCTTPSPSALQRQC